MTTETHWRHLLDLLAPRGATPAPVPDDAWEGLLALADRLEVQPLLYSRIHNQDAVAVPPATLEALRHAYLRTTFVNTQLYHHLGVLLNAARAADIPVIVLKGACLAEVVYGDIGLRPMCDVDLLVRPEAMAAAHALTEELGYRPRETLTPAAGEQGPWAHGPQMLNAGGQAVEWHSTIAQHPWGQEGISDEELDGLWDRSQPVTLGGAAAHRLSPDDLLLHTCIHAARHHRLHVGGLKACHDIGHIVRRWHSDLDWDAIHARAVKWRMWHGVALALRLAHDWAGADLPPATLASVREAPADTSLIEWVKQGMISPLPALPLRSRLPEVIARPGLSGKISGLARGLFPSPGHMASLYGARARSWRLPLYYVRRIGDVTRRHAGTVWRLLSRDAQTRDLFHREAALRAWLDEA
ncbi:MAG: nucleotidyltransferase family protein [Armatimonadetes bacterium]|nr:nucleotidyltransferase family protein [Armatimonadota bacterium]